MLGEGKIHQLELSREMIPGLGRWIGSDSEEVVLEIP